jgi:hypothetical protein
MHERCDMDLTMEISGEGRVILSNNILGKIKAGGKPVDT